MMSLTLLHAASAAVVSMFGSGDLPALAANGVQPAVEREVGAHLSHLLAAQRLAGRDGMKTMARNLRVDVGEDDTFEVDLIAEDKKGFAIEKLLKLGLDVVRHKKNATTVRVTLDQIETLKNVVPGLAHIDVPAPAWPMAAEGVVVSGGTIAQAKGARGTGVKIGVIDLGFNGLADLIESEDLPKQVADKNFTKTGLEETTDHGTRVAEIINLMAPESSLVLAKIANVSQFAEALTFMKSSGVKVVNASVAFPGANFGDGTGTAANAVNKAFDDGIVPVIAAGDFGDKHWVGNWVDNFVSVVDLDPQNVLDVCPSDQDEGITFFAKNGDPIRVYLTWNEFPKATKDLRLEVYFSGTDPVPLPMDVATLQAVSDVVQKGNQAPLEVIAFIAPIEGNYSARVKLNGPGASSLPLQVQVHTSHAIIDDTLKPEKSIVTPGDAEKGVTVGALGVDDWTTGPARSYSGRGPTLSGKAKPDLVAPDGVSVTFGSPFVGTSASAPHVAGAAALILSIQPQLTATDIKNRLLAYAEPMGDATIFGSGRLDLTDDFFPPAPNPPLFDKVETKADATSVTLVAAPLADESGPVQYLFQPSGVIHDGQDGPEAFAWSSSNVAIDGGLLPNRQFKYRVQARDSANPVNYTTLSAETKLRTLAATPVAPDVGDVTSDTVKLAILNQTGNPTDVEYALFFVEENKYVAPDGTLKKAAVWATLASWKSVTINDLDPASPYQFKAKARNKTGIETVFSATAFVVTAP
jgi:subtilisin family serine protease